MSSVRRNTTLLFVRSENDATQGQVEWFPVITVCSTKKEKQELLEFASSLRLYASQCKKVNESTTLGLTSAEAIRYDRYIERLQSYIDRKFEELRETRARNPEEVNRRIKEFEELSAHIASSLVHDWQSILLELEENEE